MKKLISLLSVFFLSTAVYAANKIEMVTYFPVPYVAYSRVQVDKILDIGLTNVCNMSLGCTESGNAGLRPLHVQDAYLETGSLDLTRALAVRSNNVSLGANAGEANIDFNDSLRVKNLNDGYSLETGQLTVDALKLFPNRIVNNFPSCAATGADGAPQVSWQKLKIKGKEETFLVCGTPKEGEPVLDCSDRSYKLAHKSECCPSVSKTDTDCWTQEYVWTDGGNSLGLYQFINQMTDYQLANPGQKDTAACDGYVKSGTFISGPNDGMKTRSCDFLDAVIGQKCDPNGAWTVCWATKSQSEIPYMKQYCSYDMVAENGTMCRCTLKSWFFWECARETFRNGW